MTADVRHYFYLQDGPAYAIELRPYRDYEVLSTTVVRASADGPVRFSHVVRDVQEAEAADAALQAELDEIASGYA